jgi:hypothetical protein
MMAVVPSESQLRTSLLRRNGMRSIQVKSIVRLRGHDGIRRYKTRRADRPGKIG